MNHPNNHSVCWNAQAVCYTRFTNNQKYIDICKQRYEEIYLAQDGSFPQELERTKLYHYSIYVFDNMVNICLLLSDEYDDLWEFTMSDGRNIRKGLDYIYHYIDDIYK